MGSLLITKLLRLYPFPEIWTARNFPRQVQRGFRRFGFRRPLQPRDGGVSLPFFRFHRGHDLMSVTGAGQTLAVTSARPQFCRRKMKLMTAKTPPIRILACTPLSSGGSVRALLRVQVAGLIFNNCRLICDAPDALPVVSPPMVRWLEADGTKRYRALCEWPKFVREAVNAAARQVYASQLTTEEGGDASR
jgi:hypothetical protein